MSVVLTTLKCEACGAPLRFDPSTPIQSCPYCDAQIVATTEAGDPIETGDWSFRKLGVKRGAFEKALLTWLADGDYTPDDILAKALVRDHTGVFVPFFRITGHYDGNYSALKGTEREEEVWETGPDGEDVQTTKTVTDYEPVTGQVSDDFEVWVCASAKFPQPLRDWARKTVDGPALEKFDVGKLGGLAIEDFALDPKDVTESHGRPLIEDTVKKHCERSVGGDSHKDLVHNFATRSEKTQHVYHPFWVVRFEYKGEHFDFVQDGVDIDKREGNRPVDEERKAQAAAFMRPFWIALGITLVVSFLGCFTGGVVTVPALLLGLPVSGFFWWSGNGKRQAMIDKSKKIRQQVLQRAKLGSGGQLGVSEQAVEAAKNQVERQGGGA